MIGVKRLSNDSSDGPPAKSPSFDDSFKSFVLPALPQVSVPIESSSKSSLEFKYKELYESYLRCEEENKQLKQTVICQGRKIHRRDSKLSLLGNAIRDLKSFNHLSDEAFSKLKSIEESHIGPIINRFLKNSHTKIASNETYPDEVKEFAQTMFFYSPAAYEHMREYFKNSFPSHSTIRKWNRSIDCSPGYLQQCFEFLHQISLKKGQNVEAALMFDAMSIKAHIEERGGKLYGFADYGLMETIENPNTDAAKQALVFLTVADDLLWKVPTSFFFVSSVNAKFQTTLVKESIARHYEVGINIVSITADGLFANIATFEALGAKLDPYKTDFLPAFHHPIDPLLMVFTFICASHALKNVRNSLSNLKEISTPYGTAKFAHLEMLLEIINAVSFKFDTKLTKHHVFFKNASMKVRLAVQLLSKSTADALRLLKNEWEGDENPFNDAEATIQFCQIFNEGFDMLNSMKVNFNLIFHLTHLINFFLYFNRTTVWVLKQQSQNSTTMSGLKEQMK